jgi:uncharacterized protein YndB with AHSA1/START domain
MVAHEDSHLATLTVERSIWINAPRERVWQAITSPEALMQWYGDYWEFSSLELGAEIKFGSPDDFMIATIQALDAPHRFVIRWPPQEGYHDIAMQTTYTLSEENGGTRVVVTETGFEALPDDIREHRYQQTAKGYETVLEGLKHYIERSL